MLLIWFFLILGFFILGFTIGYFLNFSHFKKEIAKKDKIVKAIINQTLDRGIDIFVSKEKISDREHITTPY